MKEREITLSNGRKAYINEDETPHIIPNAERIEPDTRLDDAIDHWRQLY